MDIMVDVYLHLKCSRNFEVMRYGWLITARFSYR